MTRSPSGRGPALPPAVLDLEHELARIASLNKDELRALWRRIKGREPPRALSKDLITRSLAHATQEECLDGVSSLLRNQLAAFAMDAAKPARYVKTGSIIVREYQGQLHEVVVAPEGFLWQGEIYTSLSTIARKITGTHWNGPRFFGLRCKAEQSAEKPEAGRKASAPETKSASAVASKRIGDRKRAIASKAGEANFPGRKGFSQKVGSDGGVSFPVAGRGAHQ